MSHGVVLDTCFSRTDLSLRASTTSLSFLTIDLSLVRYTFLISCCVMVDAPRQSLLLKIHHIPAFAIP